ncbi:MAG: hypothetical protein NWQ74_02275 [Opitutales bacterium]|jgi:hypothetical protein|nr:hypothetical protein [Opitutales bacterium]MDP4658531.1 hypothetical protein [Opitutales bacterium]MDP4775270.1 hypothetical protein [Opitutales bacterium]MDP4787483.1 hypothetical protein [Opitutales bacterium]MDP4861252.1 hypothetical protein [Opitutales bacterium]
MGQRERFVIFLVGALLGVMVLLGGKSCGSEKQNQLRMVRSSLSMAPMMYDYAVQQKGFYGAYVLFEQVAEAKDGGKVRTLVTGGTRRYSPEGKELPEEHILIKETYAAGVALAEPGPVSAYAFTFADRIALKLKPGHQAAEVKIASGDVAAAWAGHEEVLLRLDAWRKQPGGAPWGQLEALVCELNGHPAVAEAKLVRIDWVAEADLIKANSPK